VGMSSGASMVMAREEARLLDQGTIVVIFPDGGERYLSTPLFTVREKIDLKLFNTMTRQKEPFEPTVPGKASIYSCGPTAHARMHIGECRRFVFADLLCRYLEFRDYTVTHVMNITDLDDKTINGSEAAGESLSKFTEKHIQDIESDLEFLGVKQASEHPRASDHIDEMVALAESLVKKRYAYEKLRSLYFDLSRFTQYGNLSGVDINKIKVGATVDLDEYEKENPRDFTLFKRASLSELKRGIYTKTPWGNVRPSWHIQCAAMAMKFLGESFDIHTAGRELIFPHHENEIAISMAVTGKPLAKYWLHCDQVMVKRDGANEKGSMIPLKHLIEKGFSRAQIRYWLLSNHYRKPLAYSEKLLEDAGNALKRIDACVKSLFQVKSGTDFSELDQLLYDLKQGFINAMDDDLNIAAAMAGIFKNVKQINILIRDGKISSNNAQKLIDTFRNINTVLNIFDFDNQLSDPEIERLLLERQQARSEKNWEVADAIRDQLMDIGVIVRDSKNIS
jgi:cysteinyl-tRNA synthetase